MFLKFDTKHLAVSYNTLISDRTRANTLLPLCSTLALCLLARLLAAELLYSAAECRAAPTGWAAAYRQCSGSYI